MFSCESTFTPAKDEQPVMDEEEDAGIVYKSEPKPSYLPGERLLKRINKKRAKEREKKRATRNQKQIDMALRAAESQMAEILSDLSINDHAAV